jgi:hypothetical protein
MKSVIRWSGAHGLPVVDPKQLDWITELDWRALGWCRPVLPEPLVYLGTPGPRRKAVVHLIDVASHACELIVKVPMTEGAKAAIEHEAETLFELQHQGFEAAPRLVAFDADRCVSSQTVVRGVRCGMTLTREVAELLRSLALPGETITLREVVSPLEKKMDCVELGTADAAAVSRALQEVDDPSELPAVRTHGDFAPWNIRLQNGSAALVDWEDSEPRGLPFHDVYHFVHMTRYLFGRSPRPAFPGMCLPRPAALNFALRRKLELAYLLQRLFRELAAPDDAHAAFLLATLRMTMEARP